MLELFSEETRRNPFPLYHQMRAMAPVFREPTTGLWLLFDHASVKRALQDHDAFGSAVRPGGGTASWLIFQDPPRHTRLRALIGKAFTPRAVAELEPRIREISRRLLTGVRQMDLVLDYAVPLPLMVIAEMLGAPLEDVPMFRRWSDAMIGLAGTLGGGARASAAIEAFMAVHEEMGDYVAVIAEDRRAEPRRDLLSGLVAAEVDGDRLSHTDILAFFQLLLLAGHETTTNLIDNTMLTLLEHPAEMGLARRDPSVVPGVIEEVLRLRSPVQTMFRITKKDVAIGGAITPPGETVLAIIGAANRDPAVYADPDRFDLGRTPVPHLAFGHGIHACLGAPLARLEARIAIPDLLALDLRRADDGPWEPREAFHVHGPNRLPVVVQ